MIGGLSTRVCVCVCEKLTKMLTLSFRTTNLLEVDEMRVGIEEAGDDVEQLALLTTLAVETSRNLLRFLVPVVTWNCQGEGNVNSSQLRERRRSGRRDMQWYRAMGGEKRSCIQSPQQS